MKKVFTPKQKANVVLATIKGDQPINQISSIYQVHPTQIQNWKKIVLENLPSLFTNPHNKEHIFQEKLIEELYKQIGQSKVELDWLKKKLQPFNSP
jgi:transposase-like protein